MPPQKRPRAVLSFNDSFSFVINLYMMGVRVNIVEVGQLHIVAVDTPPVVVVVVRHREGESFEVMLGKWEDIFFVAGVMEWDTHARCEKGGFGGME